MHDLVAVASRHSATRGIVGAIGRALREEGLDVDVLGAESVQDFVGYDAVVLGSAVSLGRWPDPARELAEVHGRALFPMPTWLVSSGPVGDPPKPAPEDAVKLDEAVLRIGARSHRLLAGELDRSAVGFGEKAVVVAFRAPDGDSRDGDEIAHWSRSIASECRA